jgi:hypothetical protein
MFTKSFLIVALATVTFASTAAEFTKAEFGYCKSEAITIDRLADEAATILERFNTRQTVIDIQTGMLEARRTLINSYTGDPNYQRRVREDFNRDVASINEDNRSLNADRRSYNISVDRLKTRNSRFEDRCFTGADVTNEIFDQVCGSNSTDRFCKAFDQE